MGLKSKNGKQSAISKKPTIPRPWPDLPPQLLNIVAKNSTLRKNISYGGNVTKSYRVPPKQCKPIGKSPFPQLIASSTDQCYADTFNIPFHPGFYIWRGRHGFGSDSLDHIVGYSHGLLFARGRWYVPSSQLYLWNLCKCAWLNGSFTIPPWDTSVPFKHGAISSSPIQGTTPMVMVLTGMNHPAFAFYRLRGDEYVWIKQDCTLVDPHSTNNQLIQFTHAIGFNGKFYALSLQGTLAVIEEIDSRLRITGLSKSRAVPSVPSMHFKEYLVESNGEILLVFQIASRKSIRSVDNVEVYRLRFDTLSWVKMESIGDRTLFVGTNCCLSVNAIEIGCIRNCIYFSYQTVEGWWVYDMERGSISPGWNSTDSRAKSPVWDEPEEEEQLVCKKI